MSNKDVRKPAPGAGDEFWNEQRARFSEALEKIKDAEAAEQAKPEPEPEPEMDEDERLLAYISPERRAEWAEIGHEHDRRLKRQFNAGEGEIDDDEALSALDVCTRFLKQLVSLTSAVLETIDVQSMRTIVAGETNLPRGMVLTLKAAGIEVGDVEKKPKEAQASDHRKRPRGARHPLMVLVNFSLQATRLIQKITAGTNPGSQNLKKKSEGSGVPGIPGM